MIKNFQNRLMSLLVTAVALLLALAGAGQVRAADELSHQLQKGLLAEEAHRDYQAALKAYQAAVAAYDTNRQAAATAVFRLAETYRKLGRTNEARVQYERVVFEFADQLALTEAALKQLGIDPGKTSVPDLLAAKIPDEKIELYLRSDLRMREVQLASLKKLNWEDLALTVMRSAYDEQLSSLLRMRDELRRSKAIRLKEFAPEHPELQKLEAALKENEKLITQNVQVYVQQLEEKVKLLREQLNSMVPAPSAMAPTGRVVATVPQIPAEEQTEIERLQAMLKNSPDLMNGRVGENERAPLHEAAEKGQMYVARFLLGNGAKVNLKAKYDYTPLHLAAENGHKAMVELLLENGADTDAKLNIGDVKKGDRFTPLHLATTKGFGSVVEVLVTHGAKINEPDKDGNTPLHIAVGNEDVGLVKLLVDRKADLNAKADRTPINRSIDIKLTPFTLAARTGNVPILKILLNAGAKVDEGRNGWSALLRAVAEGKLAAVDFLLENQANPNVRTTDGQTPLMYVPTPNIAEKLLTAGADVNAVTDTGRSALLKAVENNGRELVSTLLHFKADPNLRAGEDGVPLLKAVAAGSQDIVTELIQAGANVDATDSQAYTALHYAVAAGDLSMVELLLKHQAKPDETAKTGYTPLMLAELGRKADLAPSNYRNSRSLPKLDRSGGSRQIIFRLNETTQGLASEYQQIIKLLISSGADEFRQLRPHIVISRLDKEMGYVVFSRDSSGGNRYSLFELLVAFYQDANTSRSIAFPDFSRVTIRRLEGKQKREITVNVVAALETGDSKADIWLEWGDVVEIAEADHDSSEYWGGLKDSIVGTLQNSSKRKVALVVKGQKYELQLVPTFRNRVMSGGIVPVPVVRVAEGAVRTNLNSFYLSETVFGTRALLSSSDTKRVKVIRMMPGAGGTKEMVYDIGAIQKTPEDLWLRDGDVIEVPEKE